MNKCCPSYSSIKLIGHQANFSFICELNEDWTGVQYYINFAGSKEKLFYCNECLMVRGAYSIPFW